MQQYKKQFSDEIISGITTCNIQKCIRLNDITEIGDDSHLGVFHMMGLFSFRHWTLQQTIHFWNEYLKKIGIVPTHVTIHKDRKDWSQYHKFPVKFDDGCIWTDGNIGGYCTEYYVNDLEIGNIVNPLGTCIDVGFGFERLDFLVNGSKQKSRLDSLIDIIKSIIESNIKPSNTKQGYVLRKLLRQLNKEGGTLEHQFFIDELNRQKRLQQLYMKLKNRHSNKTKEWWFDTHGIDIEELSEIG